MDLVGQIVIQIGEGYPVFRSHRLSDNDFVDVIKLVPIFISEKNKLYIYLQTWHYQYHFE